MNKSNNKCNNNKLSTGKRSVKLQQSGNDKNGSDNTNDLDMSDVAKTTNKSKTRNGLINGVTNEDNNIKSSTKTSKKDKKHSKQKYENTSSGLKDCVLNTESVVPNEKYHINNNVETNTASSNTCAPNIDKIVKASTSKVDNIRDEKVESKTIKGKSKSKCSVKSDSPTTTTSTDHELSDFDITSLFRSKYNAEKNKKSDDRNNTKTSDDCAKDDLINKLEDLDINKDDEEIITPIENPIIEYVQYESELQMPMIMKIIQKDLSEPYSIYTYRYFIHNWPNLCFLAMCDGNCVGAIVCKLDLHRKVIKRGYIAMLAVDKNYRKNGIGSTLVRRAIQEMISGDADEVVLETEITNKPALRLYEALGFVRDKRLFRYYLNGVDALRLKLWLR